MGSGAPRPGRSGHAADDDGDGIVKSMTTRIGAGWPVLRLGRSGVRLRWACARRLLRLDWRGFVQESTSSSSLGSGLSETTRRTAQRNGQDVDSPAGHGMASQPMVCNCLKPSRISRSMCRQSSRTLAQYCPDLCWTRHDATPMSIVGSSITSPQATRSLPSATQAAEYQRRKVVDGNCSYPPSGRVAATVRRRSDNKDRYQHPSFCSPGHVHASPVPTRIL